MAIIKCKMCGGDLNLAEGQSVAECEYCGSRQTVPAADNEKKLSMFGRANRLRASCDFDKAAGIYESILTDFPEEAEAYWGLVLCKYGIEYVDDPASGKKIPTCHRSSFDSVLEDENFEQAMENADAVAQRVYREEAKQLERIRKGILEVSSAEQPYDIFICYKETDENGDRTLDSVLAQDLYDRLTDKGYRVFFSRITLQGKLGEAYEPYIFAALNSAKVMLAVGTCYEYYNAVWVKNEWSRYLKLCASDKSRHLIPCYKNLDPEDMPREFSHLQGADLGKMGADQDILFNMEKYIPLKKNTAVVREQVVVSGNASGNQKTALLERGNMALEDGDFAAADKFFEEVLNHDAKCAAAYIGKALAAERCNSLNALTGKILRQTEKQGVDNISIPQDEAHIQEMAERYSLSLYLEKEGIYDLYGHKQFSFASAVGQREAQKKDALRRWSENRMLARAMQFADGGEKALLEQEEAGLTAALNAAVQNALRERDAAKKEAEEAYAAHLAQKDDQLRQRYEEACAYREEDYRSCEISVRESNDPHELKNAWMMLEKQLAGYRESAELVLIAKERAAEILRLQREKKQAEEERRLAEQKARQAAEAQERARIAKKKKTVTAVAVSVVSVILIVAVLCFTVIIPNAKYEKAVDLIEAEQYIEAYDVLIALDGYKDSAELADSIYHSYNKEKLQNVKVGDCVLFGEYEQDNNEDNLEEPIEWKVLERDGDSLVLISKYVIEAQQYHESNVSTTWAESDLRRWSNFVFYTKAFSEEEKQAILLSTLTTPDSTKGVDGGPDTEDYVYLLSVGEAEQYFADDEARVADYTPYVIAQEPSLAHFMDETDLTCGWFLRSPGYSQENRKDYASGVGANGAVSELQTSCNDFYGVRPVIRIDLNAGAELGVLEIMEAPVAE